MVQKEVKYVSPIHGIRGLLDEGRTYMLSDDGTDEKPAPYGAQRAWRPSHALPASFSIEYSWQASCPARRMEIQSGSYMLLQQSTRRLLARGLSETGPLAPGKAMFGGPLIYAPFLTSVVTPPFLKFLVGPSRTNYRKDGQLGGIVVEKCKFLQGIGLQRLMLLHQCKLPAQQFFADKL